MGSTGLAALPVKPRPTGCLAPKYGPHLTPRLTPMARSLLESVSSARRAVGRCVALRLVDGVKGLLKAAPLAQAA